MTTSIGRLLPGAVIGSATSLLLLAAPVALGQIGPPVRVLGPSLGAASERILSPTPQIRPLPGGKILVNDGTARRLLLLDSAMNLIRVVADSTSASENPYGPRAGRLIPYRGDSSLLVDGGSLSMLVIDGEGNIVKIRAVPRSEHVTYISSSGTLYGNPAVDAEGRLVYRTSDALMGLRIDAGGGLIVPTQPDSGPVLRMNLATRKLDTAGMVKIQQRITEPVKLPSGGISMRTLTNPMPVVDDWAVMSDGSVAFVRHRDYHIDWLNPDGSWSSSPSMPFDWQRLTDEHKKAFIDSLRYTLESSRRRSVERYDSLNLACFKITPPERPPLGPPPFAAATPPPVTRGLASSGGDPAGAARAGGAAGTGVAGAGGAGAGGAGAGAAGAGAAGAGAAGAGAAGAAAGRAGAGAGVGGAGGAGAGGAGDSASAIARAGGAGAAGTARGGGTGAGDAGAARAGGAGAVTISRGGATVVTGTGRAGGPPDAGTRSAGAPAPAPMGMPVPSCPAAPYQVESMFASPISTVSPEHLPDYKPPFAANSTRADADGNLWIRVNQMRPVPDTYLFDIVNRRGELFDRVQIPLQRTLVGFGPGNIAYLTTRTPEGIALEKVRWR